MVDENPVGGGGHADLVHELLGEPLRALETGRPLHRTEACHPPALEAINDAGGQRCLRADNGQRDVVGLSELHQGVDVAVGN